MTFLQAVNNVESAAAKIEILDPFGDPLLAIEVIGLVNRFHGTRWDQIVDDLESEKISPATYAEQSVGMVEEFSRYEFRRQVERKLLKCRLINQTAERK